MYSSIGRMYSELSILPQVRILCPYRLLTIVKLGSLGAQEEERNLPEMLVRIPANEPKSDDGDSKE